MLNQLSVLTNIGLGILLIPLIYRNFGPEGLSTYLELMALKAVIDIFTSSLGGGVIRAIIDGGGEDAFKSSTRLFSIYSIAAIIVSSVYFKALSQQTTELEIYFYIHVFASLVTQPLLQRAVAYGQQHIPPTIRITQNTLYFSLVLIYAQTSPHKEINKLFLLMSVTSVLCLILSLTWSRKVPSPKTKSNKHFTIKKLSSSLSSYAFFAVFLSMCSQIETLALSHFTTPEVFAILISAWKVPNIITQLIWRYCEVNGAALKSNKTLLPPSVPEVKLLAISVLISFSYYFSGEYIYKLWMGSDFNVDNSLMAIFAIGIVPISMNRLYTAYLQFTGHATQLGVQYLAICASKITYILLFSSQGIYGSFVIWFALEFAFYLKNRQLITRPT